MKYIFFLSLPLYALDRVTKHWVLQSIDPRYPKTIVPDFFNLVNITNAGAAFGSFGSFKNNNTFFIAISCVAALLALILLLARPKSAQSADAKSIWLVSNRWRDISLALLLAGVLVNLTDRLLYGHVIDFLLFDFGSHVPSFLHPWPAFNVADSCICIAVVFFIIHSFRTERKTPTPA